MAPDAEPETEPELEAEPEPDAETTDTESEKSDSEPAADDTADTEPEPVSDETSQETVDVIKGIGPAYADRLAGAGVDTVGELAGADAAELAEQTDISEKRIQGWIDRAEVR